MVNNRAQKRKKITWHVGMSRVRGQTKRRSGITEREQDVISPLQVTKLCGAATTSPASCWHASNFLTQVCLLSAQILTDAASSRQAGPDTMVGNRAEGGANATLALLKHY